MVSSASSAGLKATRFRSLLRLLEQYAQSYMQWLVIRILKSEMHLPSAVKLWQIPQPAAVPSVLFGLPRVVPLDAHETSYLAASARIFSFSSVLSFTILQSKQNFPTIYVNEF